MSNDASSLQCAPAASWVTTWRKRSYFSNLASTRWHSVSWSTPGCSSQTPTIIIRLTSLSMRSHAVSTRDMRWRSGTDGGGVDGVRSGSDFAAAVRDAPGFVFAAVVGLLIGA